MRGKRAKILRELINFSINTWRAASLTEKYWADKGTLYCRGPKAAYKVWKKRVKKRKT